MLREPIIGTSEVPVLNDLTLWYLEEVLIEMRRVDFGVNNDNHIRREEVMRTLIVKVEEVEEADNAAAAKISEENVAAVDLPCLYSTMSGLIKRGIDVQDRIT